MIRSVTVTRNWVHLKNSTSRLSSKSVRGSFLLEVDNAPSTAATVAAVEKPGVIKNREVGKELISKRDKQMGPNISVFYKQDGGLVITSAKGVYMRDIGGNKYLDCANNVACVGHSHPAVVRAGRKHLGLVQTNGRFLNPTQQSYVTKLLATFPSELNTGTVLRH
jgi:4-aminobutyrate aminotransferase-like enzyme